VRLLGTLLPLLGIKAALAAAPISPHNAAPDPYFETNRGQADPSVAFVARGPGYAVLLQRNGSAVYRFPGVEDDAPPLSVEFPGRHAPAGLEGEQPLASVTNYYGGCRNDWLPAIPHFQRVRFRGIYPGIDLVWRSRGADLEYEFLAGAGADPGRIRVRFTGARRVSVDGQGNLILETPLGKIPHRRPVAWQEIAGRRQNVEIALRLEGTTAGFQLGPYDRHRPLRIDPVLAYSTYVGGAGYDAGYAITVDGSGGVYMTGTTASIGFPAQGSGVNSHGDAFVMKFNESGALLYNTILASNGNTSGQAIAVDLSGHAYIAGTTQSTNFPATKGAWQTVFGGVADAFAAKLDSTGKLVYASYIGGMGQDTGTGIAIDSSGNAYISGYTSSVFPTTSGAAQKLYGGGFSDAFLVKLNSLGSAAVYSTLLGGTGNDVAEAVAVDTAGHACIAGYTDSANLAVHAAMQPLPGGEGDALIACLSTDGTAWTMVSYLGGSNPDQAFALAIDRTGNLYVAGTTYSPDFPITAGVFQPANAGGYDAFIAKLSPGGASLVYATYLGGNGSDAALAVAVGSTGDVWIGGYTVSTNFPLSGAWQSVAGGSFDGFVSHLSPDATVLLSSSYLGGTGDDRVLSIALDPTGLVFATGSTLSTNFPVTAGAMQGAAPAGMNAFVANISPSADTISGQVTCAGNAMSGVTMTLTGSQNNSAITNGSGYYSFTVTAGGTYLVTPSLSGYAFGPQNQGYSNLNGNPTANFTASPGASYTISGQVTLSGSGMKGTTMTLSGSQTGASATDPSGNYSFTVQTGGTYTVTPSLAGFTFSPAGVTFSNLTTNQTANFKAQCAYSVSPSAPYLDSTSQAGPTLNVTAGPGCAWTASGGGFITIAPGASGTGNGAVTFTVATNSSGAVRTGTLTAAGQTVTVTQRATAEIFADVPPPAYYFDFADLMHQAAITAGCSAQPPDYCPNSTTTRGEMGVFLIAAIERGNSFAYTTTPYFTDVPPSNPYFKFIQKLRDLGITGGCTATTYCPDDAVTRGDMAVFIIASRYGSTPFTYPSTPYFTDVPPSNLFFHFIQKMAQTGITAGCAPGLYCPNETLTRGQMAVFIVTGLLNELLPAGTPAIASAVPNSASPGQIATVTLTGVNTHFVQGTTQVAAPAGVTPSNITVLSGTSLTVQLAVGASVAPNPTTIVVTTGTEEAVLPNGFLVQ
jgi:hypothetical protein